MLLVGSFARAAVEELATGSSAVRNAYERVGDRPSAARLAVKPTLEQLTRQGDALAAGWLARGYDPNSLQLKPVFNLPTRPTVPLRGRVGPQRTARADRVNGQTAQLSRDLNGDDWDDRIARIRGTRTVQSD